MCNRGGFLQRSVLLLCVAACQAPDDHVQAGPASVRQALAPPGANVLRPGLFGMHKNHGGIGDPNWNPVIPIGAFRFWDSATRWQELNPSQGVFDYELLDWKLANLADAGVEDVVYTAGMVPDWVTPQFTPCKGVAGKGCDLPPDLDPDGGGANQEWKDYIVAVATHLNDPAFLDAGHPHVRYWETWNEWSQNPQFNPIDGGSYYVNATYAQMVRLTEDMRCLITGTGSVNSVPCTAPAIDPTAVILTPSVAGDSNVLRNFLYCNGTHNGACETGSRGSEAVDVINSHFYTNGGNAEAFGHDIQAYKSFLSAADAKKPFWSDEGSWGPNDDLEDSDLQAAFVPRYYMAGHSAGADAIYWYSYDTCGNGGNGVRPGTGELFCNGALLPSGVAYGLTYTWMVDKVASGCAQTGSIWTCAFADSTQQYEAIWDVSKSCDSGQCGVSSQEVPDTYAYYQDLDGKVWGIQGHRVPVGIKPIWMFQDYAAPDAGSADAGVGTDAGSASDAGSINGSDAGAAADGGGSSVDGGAGVGLGSASEHPQGCDSTVPVSGSLAPTLALLAALRGTLRRRQR
jgi:hypothetical protein